MPEFAFYNTYKGLEAMSYLTEIEITLRLFKSNADESAGGRTVSRYSPPGNGDALKLPPKPYIG